MTRLPNNLIIFIIGPTAVGKTALAVRLAKRLRGEIVSCDSMQIYKGMRILSQYPSAKERKDVAHHMVAAVGSEEDYNVASYRCSAIFAIESILGKGRIPIVVGGTGLYMKALIDGLFPSPGPDNVFRRNMEKLALHYGSARLHAKLAKIDRLAAASIHPNDKRRIIRALELYHSTGRTMTELKSETDGLKDRYKIEIFGLTRPREEIYAAIDDRVDRMFRSGLMREVKRLKKIRLSKTASAVLGLKETAGYLDGEYDLDAAKELMKRNTRRFAKRQLAWFRADKRIKWFDVSRVGQREIVGRITKTIGGR